MTTPYPTDNAFFERIKSHMFNQFHQKIDIDVLKLIAEFYFLFSIMEMKCMGGEFKIKKIKNLADCIANGNENVEIINDAFEFLKDRYSDRDRHYILMNGKDNAIEYYSSIIQKINDGDDSLSAKIELILLVLFRIRNNLFHGPKLEHNINIQKELFCKLNQSLEIILI